MQSFQLILVILTLVASSLAAPVSELRPEGMSFSHTCEWKANPAIGFCDWGVSGEWSTPNEWAISNGVCVNDVYGINQI